jgi:Nucleotidyltransferase
VNDDGYLVNLVKPSRNPPWRDKRPWLSADADELLAAEFESLLCYESERSFETTAIDEKGQPLRIVATDPRVWVAHKLWLSKRQDREPLKRRRDEAKAHAIGRLIAEYLPHLAFASDQLRMLPKSLFEETLALFNGNYIVDSLDVEIGGETMSDNRPLQRSDLPGGDFPYQKVPEPWRPIETAPKDGRKILGVHIHPEVQYWPSIAYWMSTPGHERWAGFVMDEQPTHWMPLPEPPKQ